MYLGRHPRLAMAVLLVAVMAISCGLLGRHPCLAMTTFNEVYETARTRLDDYNVCHTQGRALNSYGQAVLEAIPVNADPKTDDERAEWLRDALVAIACDDSDGDGHANASEIDVLTFPGSENDSPIMIGGGLQGERTSLTSSRC